MTQAVRPARRAVLAGWSLFAAMIAAAGLPIYIHAPKVYVDAYGVPLAALGLVLAGLRLIDVVQDPALGWLAQATAARRGLAVAIAAALMAASMWALFAVAPPVAPLLWFAATMTVLFSAFSFLTICFYAQGVARAATLGPGGHVRLAGWREGGSLLGICAAAVAPVALAPLTGAPFTAFAAGFALLCLAAVAAMSGEWGDTTPGPDNSPAEPGLRALFRPALADPVARRLLLIALMNAAPVAVTSTLFLFFVESRLDAPGMEGPLLLLFFLSAAASVPAWTRAAAARGERNILMAAMGLAIAAFLWAVTLGPGDTLAFAAICLVSGAALGADLTLLPALFSRRLARVAAGAEAAAFGLWSFVSKLSLALAAAVLLPALSAAGFDPALGPANPPQALWTLALLYAALPCLLKVAALALLIRTRLTEV